MITKQPQQKKKKQAGVVVHSRTSKLRHLRLVHHRQTGKVIAHRHTSYAGLACILAIVGLLLYASQMLAWASSDVNLSARVSGPAPRRGAAITSPINNAVLTNQTVVQVDGQCEPDTFVVLSSDNLTVGSTNCTSDGNFALAVQLDSGKNILSAKNYDNLNQAGPTTPSIVITLNTTALNETNTTKASYTTKTELPQIPVNPSIVTTNDDTTKCDNQGSSHLTVGGRPQIAVVCIPRVFQANKSYAVRIVTWGGVPPYALDINSGDGKTPNTLISLATQKYKTVSFKYAVAGRYIIKFKVKDSDGKDAYVQTAAMVSSSSPQPVLGAIQNSVESMSWFETPVPFYLLAVALTFGFWGGDLFDRHFGVSKYNRKSKKHVV